jgi:hypothetical protein
MQRTGLTLLLALSLSFASTASASIITAQITGWEESSLLSFGDGLNDLSIVWSTAHDSGGDGWFCGTACPDVNANAYRYPNFSDPTSIANAAGFPYAAGSFYGYEGDTIFYKSLAGYYGALVITHIYPNPAYPDPNRWVPHTLLDGRWYFQTDGSADFTDVTSSVPDPGSSLLLLGMGLAGLKASKNWIG